VIQVVVEHVEESSDDKYKLDGVKQFNNAAEYSAINLRNLLGLLDPVCRKHNSHEGKIILKVNADHLKPDLYSYENFCCEEYCNKVRSLLELPL
jgi:hypothetical protein